MSRDKPPGPAEPRADEAPEKVTPEEVRRLIEEEDADPREVSSLIKRLVLETIEEVRREIGGEAEGTGSPED